MSMITTVLFRKNNQHKQVLYLLIFYANSTNLQCFKNFLLGRTPTPCEGFPATPCAALGDSSTGTFLLGRSWSVLVLPNLTQLEQS